MRLSSPSLEREEKRERERGEEEAEELKLRAYHAVFSDWDGLPTGRNWGSFGELSLDRLLVSPVRSREKR